MTFDDLKVIGLGSVGLLALFLAGQALFALRTVDLWSVVRRYLEVRVVEYDQVARPVMSRAAPADEDEGWFDEDDEPVRDGGSTGSGDPVLPHLNQVEPVEPAPVEPVREPVILHNLSKEATIAMLAVQKDGDGKYRYSKNQIAAFVGGTKADILRTIDLYREPKPEQPRPLGRVERPANGWNEA